MGKKSRKVYDDMVYTYYKVLYQMILGNKNLIQEILNKLKEDEDHGKKE